MSGTDRKPESGEVGSSGHQRRERGKRDEETSARRHQGCASKESLGIAAGCSACRRASPVRAGPRGSRSSSRLRERTRGGGGRGAGGCRRHQPLDKLEHRCPQRVRGSRRGLTGGLVLALGLAERRRLFAGGRGVLLLLAVPERHSDVSKRVRVRVRASAASGGCQEQGGRPATPAACRQPLALLNGCHLCSCVL